MNRSPFPITNLLFAVAILAVSTGCMKNNSATISSTSALAPVDTTVRTIASNGVGREIVTGNGVAVDQSGNMYVSEGYFNRISKITPDGTASVLAGKAGTENCCGDVGGPLFADGIGTEAEFLHPNSVASDALGNVYVADNGNYRIRKISPEGMVITLAGSGIQGYLDGAASGAQFIDPTGIAVDTSGNVYISDGNFDGYRIRKITPDGFVSTLAGNGKRGYVDGVATAAEFSDAWGLAVDPSGNVYVADVLNNRIRKITPAGIVSTLAGSGVSGFANGSQTVAQFASPAGVALDSSGNVYVADANNNRIRKITPGGLVSTFAGSGIPGSADGSYTTSQFSLPTGIAIDRFGIVYVVGDAIDGIRKIKP